MYDSVGSFLEEMFQRRTGFNLDLLNGMFNGSFDEQDASSVPKPVTLLQTATSNGTNSPLTQACAASIFAAANMGGNISGNADITLTRRFDQFSLRGSCSGGTDIPVNAAELEIGTADLNFFTGKLSEAVTRAACAVFTPSLETLTILNSLQGGSSEESDDSDDESDDESDGSSPGLVTHTNKMHDPLPPPFFCQHLCVPVVVVGRCRHHHSRFFFTRPLTAFSLLVFLRFVYFLTAARAVTRAPSARPRLAEARKAMTTAMTKAMSPRSG